MTHHYPTIVYWSDEDREYVARVPLLEGCTATGETAEEALREVHIAERLWLEVARENNIAIPHMDAHTVRDGARK